MALNLQLKVAILQSGRTQREVAEAVGLSESQLSLIVNGKRNAPEDARSALASELGQTVEQLWPQELAA